MVRFQARTKRHHARDIQVVHREVEVKEGAGLREEFGERNGAGGGHLSGRKEEALKGGVEGECSAEGLDLRGGSVGHVYADGANKHARLRVLGRNRGFC